MSGKNYNCEDCNDTGVIYGTMGVEHVCKCNNIAVKTKIDPIANAYYKLAKRLGIDDMSKQDMFINWAKNQTAEIEALQAKLAELEAENTRMREALEKIANIDTTRDVFEYAAKVASMFATCVAIAKQALKRKE